MNNIPENFWKLARVLTVVLMVLLAVVAIKEFKAIGYVGANPNMMNTITVDGSGDVVAMPDLATFSFTVTENSKTVAEAQAKQATKVNAALKAVRDSGVADKDIKTQSYSINPHYEYQNSVCTAYSCPPSKSILTGYDVSQSILVKVRDLEKAGALFTSIGSLGVDNVGGLDFSVDGPDTIKAQARREAIKDAQAKADELAEQLGVRLVRITSFYESGNPTPIVYGMGGAKDEVVRVQTATPEVPTGEQKVTSNVTITYEIK
jgi:uncharacterized protein